MLFKKAEALCASAIFVFSLYELFFKIVNDRKDFIIMYSNIDMLFSNMWDDYVIIIFLVYKIYVLLVGEENMNDIVNDYVVF